MSVAAVLRENNSRDVLEESAWFAQALKEGATDKATAASSEFKKHPRKASDAPDEKETLRSDEGL